MKDFWVDKDGNFIKNGRDIQFTPDDVSYIIQRLQIKFRTFYGEYFLDTSIGVPYIPNPSIQGYISVFGKNPNMSTVDALFKKVINEEPLVDSITSFLTNYDNEARQLEVNFVVKLISGAIVNANILVP